jgi:prefoldin alpha subunit
MNTARDLVLERFKMADASAGKVDVQEKVLKYEEFIDKRLRKDLQAVYKAQEEVYVKINEYTQLKSSIIQLQKSHSSGEKLKTMVDLGTNFYCEAHVPDPSMIFVAVGFGFYVQFTFDEALKFIEKKSGVFNSSAENLGKEAAKIKAHIKIVLGGLQELQNIGSYTSEDT